MTDEMDRPVAIVTGHCGLVGSAVTRMLVKRGFFVVGIDNYSREAFFGDDARPKTESIILHSRVTHHACDIRNFTELDVVFQSYRDVRLIVHCAGQPSHDWSNDHPIEDFSVNAVGTLNMLELTRQRCPDAVFVFMSTNKVYGDNPNHNCFGKVDNATRFAGVNSFESLAVDQCLHSIFGVSKLAADVLVQEYGRNYGMKTCALRCGCLTGAAHAGVPLHGFLSYLVKAVVRGLPYTIYGFQGRQVRDNLHADDVAQAVSLIYDDPPPAGIVFNLGGGPANSCSVLEALDIARKKSGKPGDAVSFGPARKGDHSYYVTDLTRFTTRYPSWRITRSLDSIFDELVKYELSILERESKSMPVDPNIDKPASREETPETRPLPQLTFSFQPDGNMRATETRNGEVVAEHTILGDNAPSELLTAWMLMCSFRGEK